MLLSQNIKVPTLHASWLIMGATQRHATKKKKKKTMLNTKALKNISKAHKQTQLRIVKP